MEAVNAVLPPGSGAVLSALADATGVDVDLLAGGGGSASYGGLLRPLTVAAAIFALTGGAAGLVMLFWRLVNYAAQELRAALTCSVSLDNGDASYRWVARYLQERGLLTYDANLKCAVKATEGSWLTALFYAEKGAQSRPALEYTPSATRGSSFEHAGRSFWLTISEAEPRTVGEERTVHTPATLTLSLWGTDNQPIKDLIAACVDYNQEKESSLLNIYELHPWGIGWVKATAKQPRGVDGMIMDLNKHGEDIGDALLDDMRQFRAPETVGYYQSIGVPYRRGYLLHGPAGNGKSSLICAIAAQLKMDICFLSLGQVHGDEHLGRVVNEVPANSILLLEDIDATFVGRELVANHRRCTFSGLLNALDGVKTKEGRVLFITTNHPERLDPALTRPGRCDVSVYLDQASDSQMERAYLRFYDAASAPEGGQAAAQWPTKAELESNAGKFARQVPEHKVSMAAIQEHLVSNFSAEDVKGSAAATVAKTDALLRNAAVSAEMSITEWLYRLNLAQYIPRFTAGKCFFVSDLANYAGEGGLSGRHFPFRKDEQTKRLRISKMIRRTEDARADFAWLTRNQAARIIQQELVKNSELRDSLVDLIPDDSLTGFQLRDIVRENCTYESVKAAIGKQLNLKVTFDKDPRTIAENNSQVIWENQALYDARVAKEKKARCGCPAKCPVELLKENGVKDSWKWSWKGAKREGAFAKMEEKKISPTIFWSMSAEKVTSELGIENYGTKRALQQQFEQINRTHARAMAVEERKIVKLSQAKLEGMEKLRAK